MRTSSWSPLLQKLRVHESNLCDGELSHGSLFRAELGFGAATRRVLRVGTNLQPFGLAAERVGPLSDIQRS